MQIDPLRPNLPGASEQARLRVPAGELPVLGGATDAPPPSLALHVGQQVSAKVLGQLPNNHLLLQVNGTPLDAAAPPDLPAGPDLTLRVAQVRPQVVFQVLDDGPNVEAQAAQIVRTRLADSVPVGHSLATLQQAVGQAVEANAGLPLPASVDKLQALLTRLVPAEGAPTAERVATFVRDGGLLFEAKLARAEAPAVASLADRDLKGVLLQALKEVQDTPTARPLAEPVRGHLHHVEAQQAVNVLARLHGEPIQLQLPFYVGQQLATARLAVEPDSPSADDDRGDRPRGWNVYFLLDLERFGQTRIDAHFGDRSLRAVFYAAEEESLAALREGLPAFRETLRGLGYDEVLLAARPLGQLAPEKRPTFAALAAGVPAKSHLVDVRV